MTHRKTKHELKILLEKKNEEITVLPWLLITLSPGAYSEKFVAPLEEHRFYGIFRLFGSQAFILKTLPILKCVR